MSEVITLIERLRDVGCDRMPFTDEHAKCICRLTNASADEIARLQARVQELEGALTTLLNVPELADIDPEDRSEETWDAERKARALLNSPAQGKMP